VRAGRDDFDLRQADSAARFFFIGPSRVPDGQRGANKSSRRPSAAKSFLRPRFGPRIVKLRGAGEGNLVARDAGAEVIERVADEQELLGAGQAFGRLGGELVNRVQRHELDAGLGVNRRPVHFGLHVFTPAAVRESR
jgi:hypothetical protein